MSRTVPLDTGFQKFLEESYNKERDTRLNWHRKSKEEAKIESTQFAVFKKKIEDACPKPSDAFIGLEDVKPKSFHKRKSGSITAISPVSSQGSKLNFDMKPAESKVKIKLYDGFSKEGKGRYQYLLERYNKKPESKFQFPVLSSWDYGWKIGHLTSRGNVQKSQYARTRIVADTFYTRNGIPGIQCSATY